MGGQKYFSENVEKWSAAKPAHEKLVWGVRGLWAKLGRRKKKSLIVWNPLSDDFLPTFNPATYHYFLSESTTESTIRQDAGTYRSC
jgi:hypothetical protein